MGDVRGDAGDIWPQVSPYLSRVLWMRKSKRDEDRGDKLALNQAQNSVQIIETSNM